LRQQAVLVARGLTNRQIAEQLVISERTAEGHVDHIRDKLGAEIAAWVAQTGLTAQV
jgi:non-specific serine/threonine protein kinase